HAAEDVGLLDVVPILKAAHEAGQLMHEIRDETPCVQLVEAHEDAGRSARAEQRAAGVGRMTSVVHDHRPDRFENAGADIVPGSDASDDIQTAATISLRNRPRSRYD